MRILHCLSPEDESKPEMQIIAGIDFIWAKEWYAA